MDQAVLIEVQTCILDINMLALGPLSPGSLDLGEQGASLSAYDPSCWTFECWTVLPPAGQALV